LIRLSIKKIQRTFEEKNVSGALLATKIPHVLPPPLQYGHMLIKISDFVGGPFGGPESYILINILIMLCNIRACGGSTGIRIYI
jgi:hypothetical protein